MSWADKVLERRIQERKKVALKRAQIVLETLAKKRVKAKIVGSLTNDRFALHSDVDFLIEYFAISSTI